MEPLKFTLQNALEILEDAYRQQITAKARSDAESGNYDPPQYSDDATYWYKVVKEHEILLYSDTFERRIARLKRMKK